jgi:hypothetical protein
MRRLKSDWLTNSPKGTGVKKRRITTITINKSTHLELYKLKRKLKKRSFDKLLRYLIDLYYSTKGKRDPA